jgi:hypothetical protein
VNSASNSTAGSRSSQPYSHWLDRVIGLTVRYRARGAGGNTFDYL